SRRRLDISKSKRSDCQCCVQRKFEFLEGAGGDSAHLCGQNAVQVSPPLAANVDLEALAARLRPHGQVTVNRLLARCVLADERGNLELTVFPDGRAIVRGTTEPSEARSVY